MSGAEKVTTHPVGPAADQSGLHSGNTAKGCNNQTQDPDTQGNSQGDQVHREKPVDQLGCHIKDTREV
jgi:hypothetical protein